MSDTQVDEYKDRKERRFSLGNTDLVVQVKRLGAPDGNVDQTSFEAKPLDVSYSGLKMRTDCPMAFEEVVGLEFRSQSANVRFKAAAEVRWMREDDEDGNWIIGCKIASGLPAESIDDLSKLGGVERRRGKRNEVNLSAQLQLPGLADRHPITILDYSGHGVRFCSPVNVPYGQPVKIILVNDLGIELEVLCNTRWSQEFESGYLVGCEVAKGSQTKFRRWVEWLSGAVRPMKRSPLRAAAWAAAAISSVVIWFF